MVRQQDMQHLGRAQAVEDLQARVFEPAAADVGRQRFSGRYAPAQVELFAFRQIGTCEQRAVESWHTVKNRRAMLSQDAAHSGWDRTLAQQDRGRPDGKRKSEGVA